MRTRITGTNIRAPWWPCALGFLSLFLTGRAGLGAEPPKASSSADYPCHFTESAIIVDGRADDEAWKLAAPVNNFRMPWIPDGKHQAKTATRARMLWDREHLYFFAQMDDSDVQASVPDGGGDSGENDEFELFLKPAEDKPGYYEFQVGPGNDTTAEFLRGRNFSGFGRFRSGDDFDLKTAARVDGVLNDWSDKDTSWSCEGRIAWRGFARTGGRPNEGERWKFALCRYDLSVDFEAAALSTNAPLKREDFHAHEDYAPIKFIGPHDSPRAAQAKPFGLDRLPRLTTSRVQSSPEPPHRYIVERIFSKLKVQFPIAIVKQPGSDLVWIVTQESPYEATTLRRFKNVPDASELETLLSADKDHVTYDLVFHPQFAENGYVFTGSNGPFGRAKKCSRVTRYHVGPAPLYKLDADSATTILEWESDGHNGTAVAFGPDGMLYVTSGDGTSDSDVNGRGQEASHLTSKLLRIDVDRPEPGKPYGVPKDNPFIGQPAFRPETYAYGFRNPWRLEIDNKNGRIWIGNNGQDLWEQVYLVQRGANYGWSVVEGGHDFLPDQARGPHAISKPLVDHPHSEARSLTGGRVYYGDKLPALDGAYLYGDYSTGKIWAIKHDGQRLTWHEEIADSALQITAFAHGNEGDVWLLDHAKEAGIYRLVPVPTAAPRPPFPEKLTESGLFKNVPAHAMADGIMGYSVNSPLWSDHAYKERYIAIPYKEGEDRRIDFAHAVGWTFPNETVIVKSFALELTAGDPASRRWIETRFMVRQQNEWVGYSYKWNDQGTDATLVAKQGADQVVEIRDPQAPGGARQQIWHYPSRAECMVCHTRAANYLLGLQTAQMNRDHNYGGVVDNQLRTLEHLGLFRLNWTAENNDRLRREYLQAALNEVGAKQLDPEAEQELRRRVNARVGRQTAARNQREAPAYTGLLCRDFANQPRLADPADRSATLTERARSYLHANCAQCHVPAGGGNSRMDLHIETSLARMFLIDEKPIHHTLGLVDAKLVAPRSPDRSVLLRRITTRGAGQMPQLATSIVDRDAEGIIRAWIEGLPKKEVSTR